MNVATNQTNTLGRLRNLLPLGIVVMLSNHALATTYTYDPLSRLKHIDYGNGQTVDYVYDAAGNRTSRTTASPNTVTISTSAAPSGNGTVSGGGTYAAGATVTVNALPAAGEHFVNWTIAGQPVSTQASYSFTANASQALVANFAAGGTSSLVVSPTALNFGSQAIGSSSLQYISLSNTGNTTLSLTGIGITGNYSQATDCALSLAPAANCSFSVAFTPTATGTRTGSLSFTSNAPGSPFSVSLTGTGTAKSQTISFTSYPPSPATVGGTPYTVSATSTSGLPVTFSIDPSAASVCTISGSTVSFMAAGGCTIDANQGGNANWSPAPVALQGFLVITKQNGACGSANGIRTATAPIVNLCSAGDPSAVTLSGSNYRWSCVGTLGGSTASCAAPGPNMSWFYEWWLE